MKIRREIFLKYLTEAATEQLTTDYRQQGYRVMSEAKGKNIRADLVMQKGQEVIVLEIKVGEWTERKRHVVSRIRNKAVRELGAKFKLVLVNLPEEPEIEIENLESLFEDLLPDRFINEFNKLGTHFWISEISDINIENLAVHVADIKAKGSAIVTLGLQYGSDIDFEQDDGLRWQESFPFHF